VLGTVGVRVLGDRDLDAALALVARDPVANAFVGSRLQAAGLDPWRLGGEMWGYVARGRLAALCHAGANLVPVVPPEVSGPAVRVFAAHARRQGRRCSTLLGPAQHVAELWRHLEPDWGPAREVRPCQPLMALDRPPGVAPDPLVRRVRPEELDLLLPACVAMYTEEVGVAPRGGTGGYRSGIADLVVAGRSFARIEDGRVVFKAEVVSVTPAACQVQGVWVAPERRGQRLSETGMAAVVQIARAELAPVVSLYVNDYNVAARRAYHRVGFTDVGTFMSVLF